MEKNNIKKILLCVIILIIIIVSIVAVVINKNSKDTDINNNGKNAVPYEEMPQDDTNISEPSSSKQVGRIK